MSEKNISLPKNIRQIGTPVATQKVYIEDYVYTYIHNFLKEKYKDDTLKAALLLGEYQCKDDVTYAFIKGAVSCDFSQLHEKISEELSSAQKTHFPQMDMLGWYVCSPGVDSHIQSEIKHYYAQCETDIPHYLVYEDELEKEIQVFAWEQNSLHYLNGYYIYYEKNPQMQEFLIKEKGGKPQEMPTLKAAAEKTWVNNQPSIVENESPVSSEARNDMYRDRLAKEMESLKNTKASVRDSKKAGTRDKAKAVSREEKVKVGTQKTRRPQRVVYAACVAVLILLAAMGVSQVGNYQNLQQLQETISNAIIPSRQAEDPLSALSEEAPEQSPSQDQSSSEQDQQSPSQNQQSPDQSLDSSADGQALPDESVAAFADSIQVMTETSQGQAVEETESSSQGSSAEEKDTPEYYIVKAGDNLFSISREIYENEDMVEEICKLNGITNINLIFEGQKLNLP